MTRTCPQTITRRLALVGLAVPAIAASTPAAAATAIDVEAIRALVSRLRDHPPSTVLAAVWEREDIAEELETLAGLETPADYKPSWPKERAKFMARIAEAEGEA